MNGKSYVGQTTVGIKQRWSGHRWDVKKNKLQITKAITEYGPDAFALSILAHADNQQQLDELETFWIIRKRSHDPQFGYNRRLGGKGGSFTKEARATISAARKGITLSPEHCAKMSAIRKGRRLSPEATANRRQKNPNPSRCALINRAYRDRKRQRLEVAA